MRQLTKLNDRAVEKELRKLWEDNQAHGSSSLMSGDIAERLGQRVRTLEQLLKERDALEQVLASSTRAAASVRFLRQN